MKQIKINSDISLKIQNLDNENETLNQGTILIVPHTANGYMHPQSPNQGSSIITILYGGTIRGVKVDKHGKYSTGMVFKASSVKQQIVCYSDEAERQAEGYLTLLRMTEGDPVTVITVENKGDTSLENIVPLITSTYRALFESQHKTQLDQLEKNAIEGAKKFYSRWTIDGWKRRFNNQTMTAYIGSEDLIEEVAKITHPGKKVNWADQ